MSDITLFIFEGQKTEGQVVDALVKQFPVFDATSTARAVYCGDIYQLYGQLEKDEFLDVIELVRERNPINESILDGIQRDDISQIVLFFDYDGHIPNASDQKITELLACFNAETENGELYISYPMVEAIKHVQPSVCFSDERIKIEGLSGKKPGITGYKKHVGEIPDATYRNFTTWTKNCCFYIIQEHLKKANALVKGNFIYPSNLISQTEIFEKQVEKHIAPNGEVAVLSAFPLFLLDYYGLEKFS